MNSPTISPSHFIKQASVVVLYFLLGYATQRFVPNSTEVSVIWPCSGLALAVLLVGGARYVWSVLFGSLLLALYVYDTPDAIVGISLANTFEAVLGYKLLTFRKDIELSFTKLTDFVRLAVVGGGVAALIGAIAGVTVLLWSGDIAQGDYLYFIRQRWMGHAIGVALISSLILSWQKWPELTVRKTVESILLLGATSLVGQVVFLNWMHDSLGQIARGYWMFLFVTILAIRLGTRGVTVAIMIIAVQAFAGALNGTGFFSDDIAKTGLHNYWYYMLILSTVGMAVSTYVGEMKRSLSQLNLLHNKEQSSTAMLTQMGNIAHVGGWELTLADMHLSWTDEVYRIHELDLTDSPVLEGAIDFYAPEARPVIKAAIEKAIQDGTGWDMELPFITAKGRNIWVRALGKAVIEQGKVVRLHGAFQDITEHKQAEELVRSASRYARSLLEASLDPLVTISTEGRITDVNSATEQVTGISRIDMIGSEFAKYFTEPDKAREGYLQAFLAGQVKDYPLAIRHVSGKLTDVLYNASVFRDEQGKVQGVFAAARDVTEIKKAMQALNQANADLEGFSYSVSHDLRTPLRAIDGFSRILLEDYSEKLDDEGCRLLNVVRNNTDRMSKLIDDILHFSRAGRVELNAAVVNTGALTRQLLEELAPAMLGRDIQFTIDSLPEVRGDKALLHQVLENLLSNAIKFTGTTPDAHIHVGCDRKDDEVVFFVKDNGVGFDMKYADKLFGVFQRLHAINEFEGTGIGLAIAKRIVNRHGGRIWVDAMLGKGSTFYFSLPDKESIHD